MEYQNHTVLPAIAHQSKDNAAFGSQVIDTAKLTSGEIAVLFGTLAVALATFKIMESDTKTNATTLGGTPAEVVDLAKPDADQNGLVWVIDLRQYLQGPHARYIQLQATAGDGSTAESDLTAIFRGIPKGAYSSQAADRGVDNVVYVPALT